MTRTWVAVTSVLMLVGGGTAYAQEDGDAVPRGGSGAIAKKTKEEDESKKPVLVPPELKTYSAPIYPPAAKAERREGEVTLTITIDDTGKVVAATVHAGAGHGFDEAALEAAKGLLFEPATRDGKPTKARIRYRYRFELEEIPKAEEEGDKPGGLEGTVLWAVDDSSLAGASVTLRSAEGVAFEAVTNASGSFAFPSLTPGEYTLVVELEGFEVSQSLETIAAGETIGVRYRLDQVKKDDGVIEVLVEGERPPREVVKRTLTRDEIDLMPGTRGDALKSLQSLPGVARPPFISGLLIVRGSAPQDTITFIDGTDVPLIYHFGGLSSVVPTELLDKIDFYPGNFGTTYGRAMGGIVDVGLRSPKSDGYHGLAQIDFIDGRLMFEGPIPWTDDWSFLVAGRRSWVDAWLGPVLEGAGSSVTQAPVYYDYQAMVENKWSTGKLRFTFLGSDDAFEIFNDTPPAGEPAAAGGLNLHTAFQRAQVLFDDKVSDAQRVKWMLSFGHDDIDFGIGSFFLNLNIYSISNRLEYSHRIAKFLTLNGGLDVTGGVANVGVRLPNQPAEGQAPGAPFSTQQPLQVDQRSYYGRPAAYVEAEVTPVKGLRFVPGVRVDYAVDTDVVDVSPRISASYAVRSEFPKTTVKMGAGLYAQPPQFQESVPPLGTANLGSNRAIHLGAGLSQEITSQLEASGEFFFKDLDNLVVGSSAGGYENTGTGYAVGGEFMLKYKPDDWFYGWAAYTLSRTVRQDAADADAYLASFDQTHNLTVLGSLKLGSGWTVGARFRLASGSLVTPNVCDPDEPGCDPNRLNSIYYAPTASYIEVPVGTRSSERLPLFHQLDLRVDKKWQFESWALSWYLDVQNVYNNAAQENLTYNYNFTERSFVDGLPILPSMGLRGQF